MTDIEALTPRQFADELGVKTDTVLAWINAGELAASDVSRPNSTRPRWRILRPDGNDFLSRRRRHVAPKPKRRKRSEAGVIQFFK